MYDYQRFVSYIYAYENEVKSKNVGFAKAEVRNGICKININLKGAYGAGNERLDISCFYQEEGRIHKVYLGSFALRSGTGEFRYSGVENNLENSGKGLAFFQGVVIQGQEHKNRLYLSMWEDTVISVSQFTKEAKEELKAAEFTFLEVPREEIEEVIKKKEEPEVKEAEAAEPIKEAEPVVWELPQEVLKEAEKELHQEAPSAEPEEQPEPVMAQQEIPLDPEAKKDWFFEERKGTPWEKLCVRFPKVGLHYITEPIEALRIEPQDIGLLPRENWIFGNNSFLLHGYYSYRHLILARTGEKYILGVPGKSANNERFLARMFGFDSYLSNGENGYWYTEIKIGNN